MEKKSILIVDDDSAVLKYLEVLLIMNGYLVATALSGEEALKEIPKIIKELENF